MSNKDIDYIENELRATTSAGNKIKPWPPISGHWGNAYARLESLRTPDPPTIAYGARTMPKGPFVDLTTAQIFRMGNDGSGGVKTLSGMHIHDVLDNGLRIEQWQPPIASPPNLPWQISDIISERIGHTPPTSNGTAECGFFFGVPVNAQRIFGHGTIAGLWAGAQNHDSIYTDAWLAVQNPDGSLGMLPAHGAYFEHSARRNKLLYATIRATVKGIETEAWRTDPQNYNLLVKEYPTIPAGKAGPIDNEIGYCDIIAGQIGIDLDVGMSGFKIHDCYIDAPIGISVPANLAVPSMPNIIDMPSITWGPNVKQKIFTNLNPIG